MKSRTSERLDDIESSLASLLGPAIDGQELTARLIDGFADAKGGTGMVLEEKKFLVDCQYYLRRSATDLHLGLDEMHRQRLEHERGGIDSKKQQRLVGRIDKMCDDMKITSGLAKNLKREERWSHQSELASESINSMVEGMDSIRTALEEYRHSLAAPQISEISEAMPQQSQPSSHRSDLEL